MKTIFCYGDSNTWGYNPSDGERYPKEIRWPSVMAAALEAEFPGEFEVVAEGQNGRTTAREDPIGDKNGARQLFPIAESHKPIDLAIVMLGTNDLKHRFGASAYDIAKGLVHLGEKLRLSEFGPGGAAPMILLVAPPSLARLSGFAKDFEGGTEKSRSLGAEVLELAAQKGFEAFDAGSIIRSSDKDGIHLDPEAHEILGKSLAARAAGMLTA